MVSVKLVRHTPDPDKVIALAGRLCYTALEFDQLDEQISQEAAEEFITKLRRMGHTTPFEHASFTFCIEGMARVTSHQLVRHRLASFSQQSQRYVKMDRPVYVTPPEIAANPEALAKFEAHCAAAYKLYFELTELGIKKEDARYALPEAAETKTMVTMNARELMHFFAMRCCNRAQWEIRGVAIEMLRQAKEIAPLIFEGSGPGCLRGACPEKDYTCGKTKEVREFFNSPG